MTRNLKNAVVLRKCLKIVYFYTQNLGVLLVSEGTEASIVRYNRLPLKRLPNLGNTIFSCFYNIPDMNVSFANSQNSVYFYKIKCI